MTRLYAWHIQMDIFLLLWIAQRYIHNFPNTLRAPCELYYFQLLHIMHYILYAIHIYHRLHIVCYILHIITSQNVTISTGEFLTGLQILKL